MPPRKLYLSDIHPYFATLMKRQRLLADYEIDFEVFGIVSVFKDYKLAWNLNKNLHLSLVKKNDLRLRFVDHELVVSNFLYETENSQLWLLKNRSYEIDKRMGTYFVPEMTEMDYFLRISGEVPDAKWLELLRSTIGIEYVHKVNVERLKSKENFIF